MASLVPPDSAKESPAALLAWANENDIVEVDLRFVDIRGVPQHFSMPIQSVDEGAFDDGFGFDGSSIQGFQAIHESDMILLADLNTAYIDPFFGYKTLSIYCDAHDPISRKPYELDARGVAKRAEAYLNSSDLADIAYLVPKPNSSCLTMCNTAHRRTAATIASIPSRAIGTVATKTRRKVT